MSFASTSLHINYTTLNINEDYERFSKIKHYFLDHAFKLIFKRFYLALVVAYLFRLYSLKFYPIFVERSICHLLRIFNFYKIFNSIINPRYASK